MTEWRIYYGDGSTVSGHTRDEWARAPVDDVQVVVLMEPYPHGRRPWRGVDDRQIQTGHDTYSVHGWPPKRGAWMDLDGYMATFERARTD